MPKPQLPLLSLLATIALLLNPEAYAVRTRNNNCGLTTCGNVSISYPFRLKTRPPYCGGNAIFELDCDEKDNRTILAMGKWKFYVQEIVYENYTIRLVDTSVASNSCSLPRSSAYLQDSICLVSYTRPSFEDFPFSIMYVVNCTTMKSSQYVDSSRCSNSSSRYPPSSYHFFLDERVMPLNFSPYCIVIAHVPVMVDNIIGMSTSDIYEKLSVGFDLSWRNYKSSCSFNDNLSFHRM